MGENGFMKNNSSLKRYSFFILVFYVFAFAFLGNINQSFASANGSTKINNDSI